MLEKYNKFQPTDQLKVVRQTIWKQLPQEHVSKALANFIKCHDYLHGCSCQC